MIGDLPSFEGLEVLDALNEVSIAQNIIDAAAVVAGSVMESVVLLVVYKLEAMGFAELFESETILIGPSVAAKAKHLCVEITNNNAIPINGGDEIVEFKEELLRGLLVIFIGDVDTDEVGVVVEFDGCYSVI